MNVEQANGSFDFFRIKVQRQDDGIFFKILWKNAKFSFFLINERFPDKQLATVRYEKPDHKRELMKLILGGNDYLAEGRHTVIIKVGKFEFAVEKSTVISTLN